jgi:uncharacterized surface protein with fasciclin (FAS1) repeats
MRRLLTPCAAVLLSLAAAACTDAPLPTAAAENVAQEQRSPRAPTSSTIVETALAVNAETGEFSTLIAALAAADLVGALDGKGQYTVFAPTDAAFAELGLNAGNVGTLPTETLTDILLYHVTNGRRASQSVAGARQIHMLNGDFTRISTSAGSVYVNDAMVVAVDVSASNGIVHVIDSVLMPQ